MLRWPGFSRGREERGGGLVELLATVSFLSLLLVLAAANLRTLNSASRNGAAELLAFLKTTRTKAISTTAAYRVLPASSTQVITRFGTDCDDGTVTHVDPDLTLELPDGAVLTTTSWEVCYTPRGVSRDNLTIALFDLDNRSKTLEVLLGGAVRLTEGS